MHHVLILFTLGACEKIYKGNGRVAEFGFSRESIPKRIDTNKVSVTKGWGTCGKNVEVMTRGAKMSYWRTELNELKSIKMYFILDYEKEKEGRDKERKRQKFEIDKSEVEIMENKCWGSPLHASQGVH